MYKVVSDWMTFLIYYKKTGLVSDGMTDKMTRLVSYKMIGLVSYKITGLVSHI